MTQQEKDKMTKSEILERLVLNELPNYLPGINNLITSPIGTKDKWDFIINKDSVGDIKIRYKFQIYPNYVLQKDKYDYLMSTDYKNKYYMNCFIDGQILIWDLNSIPTPEWSIKEYTKNSSVIDKERIDKVITNLNVTDACIQLKTDINIVKLTQEAEEIFESKKYF